ncbi:MAG TPA: hypothetical protein VGM87_12305 [Roseomonas sp.]|jgi:hypothetical protein
MPLFPRRLLGAALAVAAIAAPAAAQSPAVTLFQVVGPRDTVTIGLTPAELDALGQGPAVDRLGRALAANGQISAWRYTVGRAADGSTRYGANGRVAIMRNDTLRIEPYTASLPVVAPPAN